MKWLISHCNYNPIGTSNSDFDKLKTVAENDFVFIVNEAVNNKMMHYAGVMTKESIPEATRLIQFPEEENIVVKGGSNYS